MQYNECVYNGLCSGEKSNTQDINTWLKTEDTIIILAQWVTLVYIANLSTIMVTTDTTGCIGGSPSVIL